MNIQSKKSKDLDKTIHQDNSSSALQWFRNAAPYIDAHRGKTVVLMFTGAALQDESFPVLMQDIALLASLGLKLVLVHGAKPQIDAALEHAGCKTIFHQCQRITDAKALPIIKGVISTLRIEIEFQLLAHRKKSLTTPHIITGSFVTAQPVGVIDGIDHLHTGKVRKISTHAIQQQLDHGNIVLLSPLGISPTGEIFNLKAEDVAVACAAALNADKLIFMLESKFPRTLDIDNIEQLTTQQAESLQNQTDINERVSIYLNAAVSACRQGVQRVHLIDRQQPDALLKELFTLDGSGCLITDNRYETIRQANTDDIPGILALITPLEKRGILAFRSREQLELDIDQFIVIERDSNIIGCVALHPFPKEKMGELACIAIAGSYQSTGRGHTLLEEVEKRARIQQLRTLFILTTQTADWFIERGFTQGDFETLPIQKRLLYNAQRSSKIYLKSIDPESI